MLIMPDHNPIHRILSIDPGTDTLGYSIIDLNVYTGEMLAVEVRTISASRLARTLEHYTVVHGDKTSRLIVIEEHLYEVMYWFKPHAVIAESPYLGRFPQAFAALVECFNTIRRAVIRYDATIPLEMIDPSSAKKAVGVSKKGSTKEDVKYGVLGLSNLSFKEGIEAESLDEHSTDSLAVGVYKCQQVMDH